ncbi:MAG: hypothetical protein M3Z01_07580 [Thermoproteota archaeon]|nr:hypothetical protein [Thermoproteota archaeon]
MDIGIEKDFPEQISSLPNRKKRKYELSHEEKEHNKNHSQKKEDSDRAYHLQIEKVQDNE